jgi:hypothetical protein
MISGAPPINFNARWCEPIQSDRVRNKGVRLNLSQFNGYLKLGDNVAQKAAKT